MKTEWKDAINEAFAAPQPENKQVFLRDLRIREVSTLQMLLQQMRYIRIPVWIFAGAIVAVVLFGSRIRPDETAGLMSEIIPYLAAVSVLESMRSQKYGMTELEMVTRFSLRSVVFARMLILGLTFLIVLVLTCPVIAAAFGGDVILTAMIILVPYLATMSISLQMERSTGGRLPEYASMVTAACVSGVMILIDHYQTALAHIYMETLSNRGIWIVLILTVITVLEQWKTVNSVDEIIGRWTE